MIRADDASEITGVSPSATTSIIASVFGVVVEPMMASTLFSLISFLVLTTAALESLASSRTMYSIDLPPAVFGSSAIVFFSGMPSELAGPVVDRVTPILICASAAHGSAATRTQAIGRAARRIRFMARSPGGSLSLSAAAGRRRRAGARGRESAPAVPARRGPRAGSPGSGRGTARSRRVPRAAPGPCRRTDGCPSRRRDGGSASARCRGGRDRRKASGSRLAAPMPRVTCVPAARARRRRSRTARVVIRLPSWFELSKRRNSSTAVRTSAGSSQQARRFVRPRRAGSARPLPIRLVVVSWPALSRKMQLCSSSGSLSRSPSSSPSMRRVSTSTSGSPGSARRRSTRPSR